jgi:hypothetical protein
MPCTAWTACAPISGNQISNCKSSLRKWRGTHSCRAICISWVKSAHSWKFFSNACVESGAAPHLLFEKHQKHLRTSYADRNRASFTQTTIGPEKFTHLILTKPHILSTAAPLQGGGCTFSLGRFHPTMALNIWCGLRGPQPPLRCDCAGAIEATVWAEVFEAPRRIEKKY